MYLYICIFVYLYICCRFLKNGKWKMENGKWKMEKKVSIIYYILLTLY